MVSVPRDVVGDGAHGGGLTQDERDKKRYNYGRGKTEAEAISSSGVQFRKTSYVRRRLRSRCFADHLIKLCFHLSAISASDSNSVRQAQPQARVQKQSFDTS